MITAKLTHQVQGVVGRGISRFLERCSQHVQGMKSALWTFSIIKEVSAIFSTETFEGF
jgi:hypothetical protein